MNNFKFVQMQPSTLAGAGASIGDTSIILTNFLDINGVQLTMADFGSKGFATIEPGSGSNEEQISFSGITQNGNGTATLTGVKTVLFKSPYTETSGLAKAHIGGVQFIITNTAGFYNQFVNKDDDGTVTQTITFTDPNYPQIDNASPGPTADGQFATKKYVDDATTAGAPNATTTVKGIVQLPTQAQVDAKTSAGSTGASLTPTPANLRATQYNDYVVDTGSASTYVIAPTPTYAAYAAGQQFTFKAATANTANAGVATLAVNGLAQKTIKNSVGGNLAINDIIVGQVVTVVYDGTNFQMINPSGNGSVDLQTSQTIAAGTKTFAVLPQSSAVPGTGSDLTNKTYVDGQISPLNQGFKYDGELTLAAVTAGTYSLVSGPYDYIQLVIQITGNNAGNPLLLQVNSVGGTAYNWTTMSSNAIATTTGSGSWQLIAVVGSTNNFTGVYIMDGKPANSKKNIHGQGIGGDTAQPVLQKGYVTDNSNTSAFSISNSSGNLSGKVKVFGLNL